MNMNFVGKVIQKNRLDATITIYWSPRSVQHISGNLSPETCWTDLGDQ